MSQPDAVPKVVEHNIVNKLMDEQWTLSHAGNWDAYTRDLNGDGVFTGMGEVDESRIHNEANELLSRDLDSDGQVDEQIVSNAVGQITATQNTTLIYDAWGQVTQVQDSSGVPLRNLRYNGIGQLIAEQSDLVAPAGIGQEDPWHHHVYDEATRIVATYLEGDSSPKEEFVNHLAGLDGSGSSSYLNDIVLRDRDANTEWFDPTDGVMEERFFFLNNWRGDVVRIVASNGSQVEGVLYGVNGLPTGVPGGDLDLSGVVDAADATMMANLISISGYSWQADLNNDGVVNSRDQALLASEYSGRRSGEGTLSTVGNRAGFAGMLWYEHQSYLARFRWFIPEFGRWTSRDPLEYVDGLNLYGYARGNPLAGVDPLGLQTIDFEGSGSYPGGGGHGSMATMTSLAQVGHGLGIRR